MLTFCQKLLTSAKLTGSRYFKVYLLKVHICVYLRARFQVSSIIRTSFRRGGNFTLRTTKNTPKSPSRLGLSSLDLKTEDTKIYLQK